MNLDIKEQKPEQQDINMEKEELRAKMSELRQKRGNSKQQKAETRAAEPGKQRRKKNEDLPCGTFQIYLSHPLPTL